MKLYLLSFVFASVILTGCVTHEKHRDANYGDGAVVEHDTFQQNGIGSTYEKQDVVSKLPAYGMPYGGGSYGGGVFGGAGFLPSQMALPSGYESVRNQVMFEGGQVIVRPIVPFASAQTSDGASPAAKSPYMTKKQGRAVTRKVDQLEERTEKLEQDNPKQK